MLLYKTLKPRYLSASVSPILQELLAAMPQPTHHGRLLLCHCLYNKITTQEMKQLPANWRAENSLKAANLFVSDSLVNVLFSL